MFFPGFRRLLEATEALALSIEHLAKAQEEIGPALERLDALERSRAFWESECEGMLLKADGKLKAAASAEQRERQLKKANAALLEHADPFVEIGEEGTPPVAPVFPNHVAGSEAEGVPPVRLALATNNKARAVRAKFGL